MSRQRKERVVHWNFREPNDPTIRVESIEHFDARGKRRVYGRGDHFGRLTLNMDVWRSRNERLLVRFWSRSDEVDWYSYEIFGLVDSELSHDTAKELSEHWVPESLRDEYDSWVLSEMRLPVKP